MLTAVLATFVGDAGSADWGVCDNDAVQWALGWAVRLQPFLECHPGSRQARGLPPRRGPVMLFSRVLPEDADSDVLPEISADQGFNAGDRVPPSQPREAVVVDESENTTGAGPGSESLLKGPSPGGPTPMGTSPARKYQAIMLEVSTGSSDVPKRTIRMPVRTDEELRLGFKVWLEPEDDQDEIADPTRGWTPHASHLTGHSLGRLGRWYRAGAD